MRVKLSGIAMKQFETLPKTVQAKAEKQFMYLATDIRHPSLKTKKYKGYDDVWQARIDRTWRFYFHIVEPHYLIISIITHPK